MRASNQFNSRNKTSLHVIYSQILVVIHTKGWNKMFVCYCLRESKWMYKNWRDLQTSRQVYTLEVCPPKSTVTWLHSWMTVNINWQDTQHWLALIWCLTSYKSRARQSEILSDLHGCLGYFWSGLCWCWCMNINLLCQILFRSIVLDCPDSLLHYATGGCLRMFSLALL